MSHDVPPPSQPTGPASSRGSSSGRSSSRPPAARRPPLVEVLSPDGSPPPPPPPPPPPERPIGLLAGIGAMVLVPALIGGLVLAYVPRLRPWQDSPTLAPAPSPSGEAPVPEGKVRLSGRVVDSDGEPVNGARVTVYSGSRALRVGEQSTFDHGAYAFTLDPGRLLLVADHDDRGMVASAELLLDQGAVMRNLVLALGPVRQIHGTIRSEEGAPIPGASLKIDGLPWLQREATSDPQGAYQLLRVPAYEATLRVTAVGYQPASVRLGTQVHGPDETIDLRLRKESDVEGRVLDPERNPVQAAIVACDGKEPGQRLTSDAEGKFKLARDFARCHLVAYHDRFAPSEPTLAERGAVELRLRPGGSIAGLVVEESGSPVRSFFVGVESFAPSFGERVDLRPSPTYPFNDAGGAFQLDRLTPGAYVLSVGAEGHALVRSSSIEVLAGQVTRGVRIVLPQGGSVEGLVFDEERRSPLPSARVSFDASSSIQAPGSLSTLSDEAGKFRLENAPTGPFSLRVEHDGYRTRILAGLRVNSGEVMKQEVGLKASGDGGTGLQFGGIGASLAQTREGLKFQGVFEGAPAEKAGVRVGDLLRKIEGQPVDGLSLADAIQRLRGEKGSQVRVTIERPPGGEWIDTVITRDEIVR